MFAAGDVRSGSTKRVASAVGEGAMAAALVHRRLEELAAKAEPWVPILLVPLRLKDVAAFTRRAQVLGLTAVR